jgi:hypothetical protein
VTRPMNPYELTAARIVGELRGLTDPGSEKLIAEIAKALHSDVGRVKSRLDNLTPSIVQELIRAADFTEMGGVVSTLRACYEKTVKVLRAERERRNAADEKWIAENKKRGGAR